MLSKKHLLLAAALLATSAPAVAGDDFGLWTGLAVEKDFNKKVSLDFGVDFRAEQRLKAASRWDASLGFSYKPCKFLKLGAGYAYIYDRSPQETKMNFTKKGKQNGYNVDHGFWRSKYRFYFDVAGKASIGRFTLSLRERYQLTEYAAVECTRDRYRDAKQGGYTGPTYTCEGQEFMSFEQAANEKAGHNRHYLRSRLQLDYDIRHCPVKPFASYETSNDLGEGFKLKKTRLSAGADWKINKKHVISLAYIYQDGIDDDSNSNIHVIDVGYKFKF